LGEYACKRAAIALAHEAISDGCWRVGAAHVAVGCIASRSIASRPNKSRFLTDTGQGESGSAGRGYFGAINVRERGRGDDNARAQNVLRYTRHRKGGKNLLRGCVYISIAQAQRLDLGEHGEARGALRTRQR